MTRYLIYQAYGALPILQECAYSLCTLLKAEGYPQPLPFQVVIYTDNPDFFQSYFSELAIIYQPLELEKWRGNPPFVHRVKIEMLRDWLKKSPDGSILYADTDTTFRSSILPLFEQIEKGNYGMHEREGKIGNAQNPLFRKLANFLRKNPQLGNGLLPLSPEMDMWNAGVLGFQAKDNEDLLDKILMLSDKLFALYPKHVMEQLAFSYHFQLTEKLFSAQEIVFHYWNFKEFRLILGDFFAKNKTQSLPQILAEIDTISPEKLFQTQLAQKQIPKWKRWWKKLWRK